MIEIRFEKVRLLGRSRTLPISVAVLLVLTVSYLSGCSEIQKPDPQPFYAPTDPPQQQEFRWSNGKQIKSLDPARAAAPPETDVVRAVFEGLTELHPVSLEAMPAVAERWEATADKRIWTFYLRRDAKWSNGRSVQAQDFVRSWRRLAELGDVVPHRGLLNNIDGFRLIRGGVSDTVGDAPEFLSNASETPDAAVTPSASAVPAPGTASPTPLIDARGNPVAPQIEPVEVPRPSSLGVKAVETHILEITLKHPDPEFPKLAANPILRPVFAADEKRIDKGLPTDIVTNGAFRIVSIDHENVVLERSENYWDRGNVELERVRFVAADNAEAALDLYRAGSIDVVTNADFAPLAIKLFEPFQDFRRSTHAALNFYKININQVPFDDRRVREALAIAIEREQLTEGELEGSMRPAVRFLPFPGETGSKIVSDVERARTLLAEAGHPDGANFPVIRLLVNRNDIQQRVARSVARMWKQNLNLDTEIIVKDVSEVDAAVRSGDFDLVRRGAVLPTSDESANFMLMFGLPAAPEERAAPAKSEDDLTDEGNTNSSLAGPSASPREPGWVFSEDTALFEFWAIPLYFPTSYALVKPYVKGFELNSLDAPLLRDVSIDNTWQPKSGISESN